MKKIQKNFIKLLAGTAITGILCLAGAKTNEKAEAFKRYDVLISISNTESETSTTTDTSVSKFVIDDQRDINYFDPDLLTNNGCAYKNPNRLENNPVELIIPKTYNGTTITNLGATMVLHAGTDINTPNWTYTYGPFYNCSRLEHKDPLLYLSKGNHIYPWEVKEYGKIGINKFKLNGRDGIRENDGSQDGFTNMTELYLKGIDDIKNILDVPVINFASNSTIKEHLQNLKVKDIKHLLPDIKKCTKR